MSDSWILIGLTILIVFLLFYMSKRLICSGPILTNSNEENGENPPDCQLQCDIENDGGQLKSIWNSSNNNLIDYKSHMTGSTCNSHVENRLRLQIFNMMLTERKHQQLELDVQRLASLLVMTQGTSNADDWIRNVRNELYPLTTVNCFQSQLCNGGRLPYYHHHDVDLIHMSRVEGNCGKLILENKIQQTDEELVKNSSIPEYRLNDIQGSLEDSTTNMNHDELSTVQRLDDEDDSRVHLSSISECDLTLENK